MRLLLLTLLFFSACRATPKAEDPVWNKYPCDHCKMLLSDPRYAAELVTDEGRRFFFDDAGCMIDFEAAAPLAIKARWVKDAESGAWLDAQGAFFRAGAKTPMDYGYSAHVAPPGLRYDAVREVLQKRRAGKEVANERHE